MKSPRTGLAAEITDQLMKLNICKQYGLCDWMTK